VNEGDIRAALAALLPSDVAARHATHVARVADPGGAIQLLQQFAARHGRPPADALLRDFLTLAGFSPYLGGLLIQNPEFLDVLTSGGPAGGSRTREDLEEDLARFQLLNAGTEDSIVLRKFKQREYLRIALADALGTADFSTLTRALSQLADVLLEKAVQMARVPLESRFGRPTSRDDQGNIEECGFTILALGKLGSEELNYSSDIDLLYLYSRDGETSGIGELGEGATANKDLFTRLATEVTHLIAGSGPEGQVFRVDLGLRPGGRDGDLVMTASAVTAYYRNWAEAWERQALIKARPVAGDLALGRRFVQEIEPLIYRRDPDPYLVLEIGAMKDRIDTQLSSQGRSGTDIKLGWGGIRELEFAVQALQLQHGGRDPWLRQGNTLLALHRLAERGLLGYSSYAALSQAYVFLRDLEHRLQLGRNRQTSTLPGGAREIEILARRVRPFQGAPYGEAAQRLAEALAHHRGVVRAFYDSVFGEAAQPRIDEEVEDLWIDRLDDRELIDRLRRSGIIDAESVFRPVQLIRRRLQEAAGSAERRRIFRKSGPVLLQAAARSPNPRRSLGNLERLVASLAAHPDSLARFLAHRELVGPIIQGLGRSNLLAGLLIRQPSVLRSLEDRVMVLHTMTAEEYYNRILEPVRTPGRSSSSRLGELRRRHQGELATIAFRDINRQATVREVLKSLSNLADAVLDAVAHLEIEGLDARGLAPPAGLRLAVLGLGRLGYRELDFGSDLDLVFVVEGESGSVAGVSAAHRWCEGIIRTLSTLSRDGQLYKVDLRLRPSGGEGELMPTLEGLMDYFRGEAEVWEMQSFLKARPVAGDRALGARAVDMVERVIQERARRLGPEALAAAVEQMRERLLHEAEPGSVKLGEGGLTDIHFAIDVLRLRHSVSNPEDKDTLRLLTHLNRLGHLPERRMAPLYEGYLFLRALEHGTRLLYDRPLTHLPEDCQRLDELASVVDPTLESDTRAAESLLERFQRHTTRVRETFLEILHSP
jgi:glutamate-ammonia-ligase adenylyltransferase